ncbi:MAG: hypothetical protein GC155_08275 [Alphaproteobacteria bacterium]|nr:hypothetical protein [Alphaproteobacteria bacterium]
MPVDVADLIRKHLPRGFLQGVLDVVPGVLRSAAEWAKKTDLTAWRSARAEGFVRFQKLEQTFQEVGDRHGGECLLGHLVPGTDQAFFQPMQRFGVCVVGISSQPEPGELPTKNKTRGAAVSMNLFCTPTLPFGPEFETDPDLYVALLVSRDPTVRGTAKDVEIAVIDATFSRFVFRQSLKDFLASYPDDGSIAPPVAAVPPPKGPLVKLKAPKSAATEEGTSAEPDKK